MTVRILADSPTSARDVTCGGCGVRLEYHVVDVRLVLYAPGAVKLDPPGCAITCLSCGRAVSVAEWSR